MKKIAAVAALLIFALTEVVAAAAEIKIGPPTVLGNDVWLPVALTGTTGSPISLLGLELSFDPAALSFVSAATGAAASAAGKQATSAPSTAGTLNLMVFGLNTNAIGDGQVAVLHFSRAKGTALSRTRIGYQVSASDPQGELAQVEPHQGALDLD